MPPTTLLLAAAGVLMSSHVLGTCKRMSSANAAESSAGGSRTNLSHFISFYPGCWLSCFSWNECFTNNVAHASLQVLRSPRCLLQPLLLAAAGVLMSSHVLGTCKRMSSANAAESSAGGSQTNLSHFISFYPGCWLSCFSWNECFTNNVAHASLQVLRSPRCLLQHSC